MGRGRCSRAPAPAPALLLLLFLFLLNPVSAFSCGVCNAFAVSPAAVHARACVFVRMYVGVFVCVGGGGYMCMLIYVCVCVGTHVCGCGDTCVGVLVCTWVAGVGTCVGVSVSSVSSCVGVGRVGVGMHGCVDTCMHGCECG